MKAAAVLLVMATMCTPLAAQVTAIHVSGTNGDLTVAAAFHRREAAFPIGALESLGARIERRGDGARAVLFGDTLTFEPVSPFFRVGRYLERLRAAIYAADGELYLPHEFFAEWLPARYPERVRFASDTLALIGSGAHAGDTPTPGSEPGAATSSPGEPEPADAAPHAVPPAGRAAAPRQVAQPPRRLWSLDTRISSVFDSNIDHDEMDRDAYGTVGRLGVGLQSSPSRPVVALDYGLRVYRFTNTARWNRLQHDVELVVRGPSRHVRPRLGAEVRLGSATEDRELANQYIVEPGLDLRLGDRLDLELYAVGRLKRYAQTAERDETNGYAGAALDVELADWLDWTVEGRYEVNDGERLDRRYTRVTADMELAIALGRRDAIELDVRRRFQDYREELVESLDVLRRDRRWTTAIAWAHALGPGWSIELAYELDLNDSNQVDKDFRAHRVEFMVRRRW